MQPMTTAVAVLLTSVLTTTGLLALATANVRGHWFLRTIAFLAALSPLLAIPAYEPLIALLLQGMLIAGGLWLARALPRKSPATESDARRPWRFSLSSLLLAMVLCGVGAAVAARIPRMTQQVWQSIIAIGASGAGATLLGYWAASRLGWRRRLATCAVAAVFAVIVGLVPACSDWLVPALQGDSQWPPHPIDLDALDQGLRSSAPTLVWLGVSIAVALASYVVVWLASLVVASIRGERAERRLLRGLQTLSLILVVIAAPSLILLDELLNREPIPTATLPTRNGSDDFLAAAKMANAENPSASVADIAMAIERGRRGLPRQSAVPLDYANREAGFEHAQHVRNLARLFDAEAQRTKANGDLNEALKLNLDNIHLGTSCRRGGLIVDGLVGVAVTGVGAAGVFDIHKDLTPDQCLGAIKRLKSLEGEREPHAAMEARDKVWVQHAYGWYGHLHQLLDPGSLSDVIDHAFKREKAQQRLLIAHLTLQAYKEEHGRLPRSWEEVRATGLPALMVDPWSPTGNPLQYLRQGDKYALYSVGHDGVDDGGVTAERAEMASVGSGGDFRIDVLYGPEPGAGASESDVDADGEATSEGDE
jgi:hypothetical protein